METLPSNPPTGFDSSEPLEQRLKKSFNFLNDEEIKTFIDRHDFLRQEKDFATIKTCLVYHFQGLASRNAFIREFIERKKKASGVNINQQAQSQPQGQLQGNIQQAQPINNFTQERKELMTVDYRQQNSAQQRSDMIYAVPTNSAGSPSKEDQINKDEVQRYLKDFMTNMDAYYNELVVEKKHRKKFKLITQSISNMLNGLAKNIKDPEHRQLEIKDKRFIDDQLIVTLVSIGFGAAIHTEEEILFVLMNDPPQEFFAVAAYMVDANYLKNQEFLDLLAAGPGVEGKFRGQGLAQNQGQGRGGGQYSYNNNQIGNFDNRADFLANRHEARLQNRK